MNSPDGIQPLVNTSTTIREGRYLYGYGTGFTLAFPCSHVFLYKILEMSVIFPPQLDCRTINSTPFHDFSPIMKLTTSQIVMFTTFAAFTSFVRAVPTDYERSVQSLDTREISYPEIDVRQPSSDLDTIASRELQPRQGEAAEALGEAIADIITGIIDGINQDKINRGDFTIHVVSEGSQQHPQFNWIICHTKHETHFDGVRGTDWDHRHQEFDIQIGGTIGYEIYWFKSGSFKRIGDGGYLNWAYVGIVKSKSADGKELVFSKP